MTTWLRAVLKTKQQNNMNTAYLERYLHARGFTLTWRLPSYACVLAIVALPASCASYASDYLPPKDGRARPIWDSDGVVASVPELGVDKAACLAAIDGTDESYAYRGEHVAWQPGIIIVGAAPLPPPLPIPGLGGHPMHGSAPVARTPASPHVGGPSGGSAVHSSSGKSTESLPKELMAIAVVAALIALPIITIGLALGRPEPEKAVAREIDQANRFNDLARVSGTPCSLGVLTTGVSSMQNDSSSQQAHP